MAARGQERGDGRFQFGREDGKVLERDSGEGRTTTWMPPTARHCTVTMVTFVLYVVGKGQPTYPPPTPLYIFY